MEQVQDALMTLLTTVAIGGIGVITAYASVYLKKLADKAKAQASKITDENQRELVDTAIDRASTIVEKTVISANETLVKEFKNATSDNKITKEDGQKVLDSVKENVLKQLSDDSKDLLSLTIGDLDKYIEAEIETTLKKLKEQ